MLTPMEIAALGAAAALRARQGEGACVAELAKLAASGVLESSDIADAVNASGDVPGIVLGALSGNEPFVRASVVAEVQKALGLSSKRDAEALGKALEDLEKAMRPGHDVRTASQAIADSLMAQQRRDNLSMAEDARRTWLKAVGDAVPKAARGELSYEGCVRQVVEAMARRGVKVIDYRSGRRVSPDVAARRHIVTQVQQAAASRSFEASEAMGEGLAYVSSHVGARPSHREWQGKPYACHGPLTIDGVTYEDLAEATGYGTPGGLCGANCRHSFGPWLHWQKPRWSETPDEDAGLDPDEAYKATQAQRANEREIRAAKLEADALREAGQDDSAARLRLGRAQASQRKLLADNSWLKRRPERERAYGTGGKAVDVKPLKKVQAGARSVEDGMSVNQMLKRGRAAEKDYAELRNVPVKELSKSVARSSGVSEAEAETAINHVFYQEHDLDDGRKRFDAEYEMAQSWKRLRSGDGVQDHDRVLVRHEVAESKLMSTGMPYREAHEKACEMGYDYDEALLRDLGLSDER